MPCHRLHMPMGGDFPVEVLASGAAGEHASDSQQGGIQACNPGFSHSFLFKCSRNLTALPSLPSQGMTAQGKARSQTHPRLGLPALFLFQSQQEGGRPYEVRRRQVAQRRAQSAPRLSG